MSETTETESKVAEDQVAQSQVAHPPSSFFGILKQLGPGLIIAGSIVGSGELIATTATGAKAGFWLLWLIILGCVIKVFVQVELGRYAITSGKGTMEALSEVPGPRFKGHGNWLIWYWFLMFVASIAQLGGIVGGVGQALAISAPLTQYGKSYNQYAAAETQLLVDRALAKQAFSKIDAGNISEEDQQKHSETFMRVLWGEYQVAKAFRGMNPRNEQVQQFEDNLWLWLKPNTRNEHSDLVLKPEVGFGSQQILAERARQVIRLDERINAENEIAKLQKSNTRGSARKLIELNKTVESTSLDEKIDAAKTSEVWLAQFADFRNLKKPSAPNDAKLWAAIIAVITAVILFIGRFGFIQSFATAMVALFTLITIVNLTLLQGEPTWQVNAHDIIDGLKFRLPPNSDSALAVALATFGIIGVGATELIAYPYWCLEKGYAVKTGTRDKSEEWAERARGWLRVMRWDAWCSMVVYTFATIAFYLLGAAVLGRTGLYPEGSEMIRTLAVMYEPIFGKWAGVLFLFGAFAVLYSTYFVANASHARTVSDAIGVLGFAEHSQKAFRVRVKYLSALFAILCFVFFAFIPNPVQLVLFSGIMQAVMLPMLAVAAIYFRYRKNDPRVSPTPIWDIFLIISGIGLLIVGGWAGYSKITDILDLLPT